jgi:hypothetical protein
MTPENDLSVCYLTVTFANDIERFALLRHSIKLFSSDIEHVVCVDSEDLPLFTQRFGGERKLTLIPTSDIIPPWLERLRRFWRRFRKPFMERIAWRMFLDVRFSGWKLQQIVKLTAAPRVTQEAIVFLDSDVFLCGNVTDSDFINSGDLLLLETPAENYEDFTFEAHRQILVGHPFVEKASCFNYIHTPPRFLRRTAARTLAHLEATHKDWQSAIIESSFPAEYNLLGWTVRTVENYAGYRHHPAQPDEWAYVVKDFALLDATLDACREERGSRKFFLIQSNMRESAYIPRARALIEELASHS